MFTNFIIHLQNYMLNFVQGISYIGKTEMLNFLQDRGGCNPKKPKKTEKKPVPNLKFAVAFGFFRFFRLFSVFFGFFRYFSVFFRFFSV